MKGGSLVRAMDACFAKRIILSLILWPLLIFVLVAFRTILTINIPDVNMDEAIHHHIWEQNNLSKESYSIPVNISSDFSQETMSTTTNNNTTLWIALHAVKGRLGNFMMQYSSAWGLATLASYDDVAVNWTNPSTINMEGSTRGTVQWCLTKATYRKRRKIIHPMAGPWVLPCPEEQWTNTFVKEWYERNETYDPRFLHYLRNQEWSMMNVRGYNTSIFKEKAINNVVVVRMVGFWSSFRYFEFIRPQLREFWKLSTPVSLVNYLVDQMIPISPNSSSVLHRSNVTYVGIHVRRGDMKSVSAYRIPGKSYYDRAMKYYDEHYHHQVHFVVSTDDFAWWQRQQKFMSVSQERISLLSSTLDPILAWTLLAQCHHIITSIGTFGWWAAYLSKPPTQTQASPTVYPIESYNTSYWTPDRLRNYLPVDWKGL